MFKKPPNLGTSSTIKNSERRNLQKELSETYAIPLEECKSSSIFPESLAKCKGTTSAGVFFTLFSTTENGPVAFRIGKGEQGILVPSIYTIWNASTIKLPTLMTNDMVLSKLQDGADLFAPGISRASIAGLPDDLTQGSIVGIGTLSVPGAVRAVGSLCCDVRQLKKDQVGKAVEVLHVEGDQLWSLGSKATATPRSAAASTAIQDQVPNGHSAQQVESPGIEREASAEQQVGASTSTSELSTADVDACLKEAVIYSIVHHLSKQSNLFPITSSKFMDTYVLPSRRAAIIHPQTSHDGQSNQAITQEVSIKKSNYKNASAFLKQMKKEGLLSTKEVKGGEVVVVGVDATHAELKAFKSYKTIGEAQKQEKKREAREEIEHGRTQQRHVEVTELYKPHGSTLSMCSKLGFDKDDLVLPTEIRTAIQDYFTSNSLINPNDPSYITLDESLSSACLKKGEQLDFMPRSEVMKRFIDNMQAWHRVVISEGGKREEIMGKGAPKKIGIVVKKRQGKKLVTIIDGLETFHIPHQKLSEDLQLKCASSSTFGEVQGTSPKKPLYEVVVQGTQTSTVVKELTETWGVPKAWISIAK